MEEAAQPKPKKDRKVITVSFRINPGERAELEKEARLAKSTLSDVARDRFRMNTGLKDLHTRIDLLESAFQAVRDDYRNLVDEERLAEKLDKALTDSIRRLGPGVVGEIMRLGVREFYRTGTRPGSSETRSEDEDGV